jgi:hypothetical protein
MSDDPLRGLVDEMVLVLAPLVEAAQAPDQLVALLAALGWTVASIPAPLLELATAGSELLDAIGATPEEVPTAHVLDAIGSLATAVVEIEAAPDTAFPSSVDIAAFKQTIGRDLLDYCIVEYLLGQRFKLGRLLRLVGIVQLIDTPASGLRQAYLQRYVNWSEVGTLLTDPLTGFRDVYGWRTATPQLPRVLSDVAAVLEAYDLLLSFFALDSQQLAFANAGATEPLPGEYGISLDLGEALGVAPGGTAGVQFFVRPATALRGPALAIAPFANLGGATGTPSDDQPSLVISGSADLTQGVAVTLAPGSTPTVEQGFLGGASSTPTELAVTLALPPATGAPERVILGSADASRIAVQTVVITAGATLAAADALEAFVEVDLQQLHVVVKPSAGDADSFIASLLGPDGISTQLSPGVRLSSTTGFHLTGSAALEGRFPMDLQIGPIDVEAVSLALAPAAQGFDIEVGAAVAGVVGPCAVTVDRVGFVFNMRFPDPPTGNLGPLDVAFGFLAPTGLGLSLDADVITGGGFVDRDPASGRYDGVLALRVGRVDVTALGLLETKLPAGQDSYALLVALSATFPGIEIGFGFALTGIGGLLALNRSVDVDALRARLASGTAGRILAPQNPIANAPSLLADLDTVFPVTPGITVVGPTAQLTWADLVQFNIGVFIELPGPTRVVLLGAASAQIAEDGRTYLSINVDVVGVVDLQGQTAAFDAALVNSHLMGTLDVTGGAALRLSWGSQPYAVLSIGGFNPSYNPAPLTFPSTLTPVAMVHGAPSDAVYLRFEGYFAITTNTLQFGASVEAQIHSGGWSIHGTIAFDALLQRVPFHFEFDINASVSVSYQGHNLASLTLSGSLSGPGPIVLKVKVSIELLFFEVSFSDTFELGPTTPPPAPTAPDLLSVLSTELADPACLHAAGGPDPLVTVTAADPTLTVPLVAPTGALVWDQQRAPLGLVCDRVGGTPLPAPAQVTAATTGASTQASDWFAPGQFINLSDDQALTQPGYELLSSGLRLGDGPDHDGPSAQVTPTVQQIRIPEPPTVATTVPFPGWLLTGVLARPAPAVTVTPEPWTLSTPTGRRTGLTGAQARQLAALTPGACAIVSTDTLPAMTF